MAEYHHRGHSVTDLKYHLIWVTKYRYAVLTGDVAIRCRDLLREICQAREVSVVRGAGSPDHVHLLVSAPAILAPAKLVQYLKKAAVRGGGKRSSRHCESGTGANIYGHAASSAPPWERSMRRPSSVTARSKNGTMTGKGSFALSVAGRRRQKLFQAASKPPHGLLVPPHPTGFSR